MIFFVIFTVCCIASMCASFDPLGCTLSAMTTVLAFILLLWFRKEYTPLMRKLKHVNVLAIVLGIISSVFVARATMYTVLMGPVLLGYLYVEGGYKHENSAE